MTTIDDITHLRFLRLLGDRDSSAVERSLAVAELGRWLAPVGAFHGDRMDDFAIPVPTPPSMFVGVFIDGCAGPST